MLLEHYLKFADPSLGSIKFSSLLALTVLRLLEHVLKSRYLGLRIFKLAIGHLGVALILLGALTVVASRLLNDLASLVDHAVVLFNDIVENGLTLGVSLLHVVTARVSQQFKKLLLGKNSGFDFELSTLGSLQVIGQLVHHLSEGSVELLPELEVIVVGDTSAHLSNIVVANSDCFQLRGVQVLADQLLLRISFSA